MQIRCDEKKQEEKKNADNVEMERSIDERLSGCEYVRETTRESRRWGGRNESARKC